MDEMERTDQALHELRFIYGTASTTREVALLIRIDPGAPRVQGKTASLSRTCQSLSARRHFPFNFRRTKK